MPATYPTGLITNLPIEIEREQVAEEFVSASGRRVSSSYWTGTVRHVRLVHPLLREDTTAAAPWNAYTEAGAIRALWAQMGMIGTVTLADPEGGAAITVKLEAPIAIQKIADGCFAAEVELVEVL